MKKFIVLALSGAMLFASVQKSHAPIGPFGICIILGATAAGVGACIYVCSCGPKFYCVSDPEQGEVQWCATVTLRDIRINGWQKNGGPWKKHEDCMVNCTNKVPLAMAYANTIHIETSTDLVNWTEAPGSPFPGDPECFDWEGPEITDTRRFYRVYYQ
jgi:hypothetical protein